MSASEITAATLDVTTTRRTVPDASTLAMMWSHVRCTYSGSSYVLTCDTWATPSQPRKISSKQPGVVEVGGVQRQPSGGVRVHRLAGTRPCESSSTSRTQARTR